MQEEKDIEIVNIMIGIYCKRKHKSRKWLCQECKELADYAKARREKCPFGDNKTFCSNCKIHCYKPSMREKISAVMRFSGPRIMFSHPIITFRHVSETIKFRRKEKKEKNKALNAQIQGEENEK
ncbi:MAG: nitrous oxide-stimulated promoter family protein [Clostridia bacterium]|nr:nitrous oxide-stimulated promoter family protein [Clostridia bacterium]